MQLFVATLIAAPSALDVMPEMTKKVADLLNAPSTSWLAANHKAVDVFFDPSDGQELIQIRALVREAIAAQPIDVAVQPVANRRKKLLIADMDSTIIQQETLDELAATIGLKGPIARITEKAMGGFIGFEEALRERVAFLKGLSADIIPSLLRDRISFTPGAQVLIATLRNKGVYTALVSGGFTLFAEPLAAQAGFNAFYANKLMIEEGKLTGRVEEPILAGEAKKEILLRLCIDQQIPLGSAIAVGDGANDLGMIKTAGLGVAFRAKPIVAEQADVRIDVTDLTSLLFIQGYHEKEFARL